MGSLRLIFHLRANESQGGRKKKWRHLQLVFQRAQKRSDDGLGVEREGKIGESLRLTGSKEEME